MEAGVQSVMTLGIFLMPELPVGSLVTVQVRCNGLAIVQVKYVVRAAPRGLEYG